MARIMVVWCPDWAVYATGEALGWDPQQPAAVTAEHRIYACNAPARAAGVRRGMRIRHAHACYPALLTAEDNPQHHATAQEDMISTLSEVAAAIDTLRPGLLALNAEALATYYGSEDRAAEIVIDAVSRHHLDCYVGIADELVTAVWAAREGRVIAPGDSRDFIHRLPLRAITAEPALQGPQELVDTLSQLGLRTLGDLAALPASDIATRFGSEAVTWHRIVSGHPEREISPRRPDPSLTVSYEPDDPIAHTDTAAFLARHLATALHQRLFDAGDSCLRLQVTMHVRGPAGYSGPDTIERVWRCREPLSQQDTAQRVRWQLDGWMTRHRPSLPDAGSADTTSGHPAGGTDSRGLTTVTCAEDEGEGDWGVIRIELCPLETIPAGSVDMPLWGGVDEGVRAVRAAAGRAQALIGLDAVRRPVLHGGHRLEQRVITVPFGEDDPSGITAHWEGELPAPLPSRLLAHPASQVELLDEGGEPIHVTGRGLLSGTPRTLCWGRHRHTVTGWAGPWLVDEQWWSAGARYARIQIATDAPDAHLLLCQGRRWRIEASY